MKRCSRCLEMLPASSFHKDYSKGDHLGSTCKACKEKRRLDRKNLPHYAPNVGDRPEPRRQKT